ncbi:MAG: hypothetical protein ABI457_01030 [Hyphomicrobium sp.]
MRRTYHRAAAASRSVIPAKAGIYASIYYSSAGEDFSVELFLATTVEYADTCVGAGLRRHDGKIRVIVGTNQCGGG